MDDKMGTRTMEEAVGVDLIFPVTVLNTGRLHLGYATDLHSSGPWIGRV